MTVIIICALAFGAVVACRLAVHHYCPDLFDNPKESHDHDR